MITTCCEPTFKEVFETGSVYLDTEEELVPGIPNPMAAVWAAMAEAVEDPEPRLWYGGIEWTPVARDVVPASGHYGRRRYGHPVRKTD